MTAEACPRSKVRYFNLHIDVLDEQAFFREFQESLSKDQVVSVNFLNAHCFNIAQNNVEYRDALEQSTFLLNDGVGVSLAGKLIGVHFKDNLNGTDLIPKLLAYFEKNRMKVFFFGASEEVVKKATNQIKAEFPNLPIVGYSNGFIENPAFVIDQINKSRADAVILGMGAPKQELWVARYGSQLRSAKVLVSGGAIFDFISGNVLRAPIFIRRIKLEWLFRFIQEPIRLFSRYVIGSFVFFYNVLVKRN